MRRLVRFLAIATAGLAGAACAACAAEAPVPAAQVDGTDDVPPATATVSLRDFNWLVGTWRGTGEGEEFFEEFRLVDDSTMIIVHYEDASLTPPRSIRSGLQQRGGRIWHTHGDARWVMSGGIATAADFEAVQNASNRFTWTRESPDRWTAVLRYRTPDGGEVEGTYFMERIGTR